MAIRATYMALLLSILPIAGCGTVVNLIGSPRTGAGKIPFGGVRQDLSCVAKAENGAICFGAHPKPESKQYPQVARMLLCAVDLPFSLLGDVVTWPYTAAYSYINQPIPLPPVIQANPAPAHPAPAQPVLGPPMAQAPAEVRPETSPLETLPDTGKLP